MDISVIVPFHNEEVHIEECVQALLAQRYPQDRYEVILVDNNSTDRSAEIVSNYPRVRRLSESKVGSYAARNRGLMQATGEIVAFTDSDCVPDPDWLDAIADAMSDPGVSLILGQRRFRCGSTALRILNDYDSEKAAYVFASPVQALYFGYTNNMAVRRSVMDAAGPFETILRGGDTVFVQRVLAASSCDVVRYAPRMRIRHLELKRVGDWLEKMRTYGRSSRVYGRLVDSRPLRLRDRARVFRSLIRKHHYPAWKALLCLLLMTVGIVHYQIGRLSLPKDVN